MPATPTNAGRAAAAGAAAADARAVATPAGGPRDASTPVRVEAAGVTITDVPTARVHHPSDLLGLVLCAVGVVLVMVLATYAHNTTSGVAEDVQGFAGLLQRILFVPVQVLESVVTLLVPLAVLTELALRRLGRQLLEAIAAGLAAVALNQIVFWLTQELGTDQLVSGLSVQLGGVLTLTLPGYVALLGGMLTVSGPRGRRRTVTWSWNLLWVAVGVLLITARASLPGLAVSLLLGRLTGQGIRYLSGVRSERAYGASLVAGVRRTGLDPVELRRVPDETTGTPVGPDGLALDTEPAAQALTRATGHRVYRMTTATGEQLDLVVVDGDRQVVGMLSRLWRSLRLRGIEGRSVVSLRQAAERSALLAYAARAAGVRTPKLLSIAEAEDSMLLVQEHPGKAVPLADLDAEHLTDELLEEIWAQLQLAHDAGVAHRSLTGDTVLVEEVDGHPVVWLTGWELGDVASSELARRMDVTQLVALLALRVGATRALGSAVAVLPDDDIAAIGPLLQTITLPRQTRDEVRAHKQVLADLRTALVARLPEASVEPQQLVRFGARTVVTILITLVAAFVVVTQLNVRQITQALATSDWRWSVVAFALGLLTLLGAALAFVAFSPVRLSVWRATLVQTAATFVALAAPAGIGPAALNLRMLTRRGVSTSLAAATVALVQVSQLAVTLLLLLVLTVVSGDRESTLPVSPVVLLVIAITAALIAATLLIPQVRQWALARIMPTLRQTWPRLIEVLGQPWRLALALGGNLLMTLGFIFSFDACLTAFGQHATLIQVALVYLGGNTAGALVPTPGGLGAIEFALATSLSTIAGLNFGIATSIALLFRVVTYWLRIPLGWVAMRYLQRQGEL